MYAVLCRVTRRQVPIYVHWLWISPKIHNFSGEIIMFTTSWPNWPLGRTPSKDQILPPNIVYVSWLVLAPWHCTGIGLAAQSASLMLLFCPTSPPTIQSGPLCSTKSTATAGDHVKGLETLVEQDNGNFRLTITDKSVDSFFSVGNCKLSMGITSSSPFYLRVFTTKLSLGRELERFHYFYSHAKLAFASQYRLQSATVTSHTCSGYCCWQGATQLSREGRTELDCVRYFGAVLQI